MDYTDFLSRQVLANSVINRVVENMGDNLPDEGKQLAFEAMIGIPETISSIYGDDSNTVVPDDMLPLIVVTQQNCASVAVDLDSVMQGDAVEKAPKVSSSEFWLALNQMMCARDGIDLIVWAALSRFGREALERLKTALEHCKDKGMMPAVIAVSALAPEGADPKTEAKTETKTAADDTRAMVCGFFTVVMLPRTLPKVVPVMAADNDEDGEAPSKRPTIH